MIEKGFFTMSINKELSRIQKALKAPKSQYNKFGNYHYRNCEDILEALKPLLGECSVSISDDIVLVGDRYYIKATAKLSLVDQSIECSAFARETLTKKGMDDAQVTGAASSYARKYALNGLFAIDDNRDADSKSPAENEQTISSEECDELTKYCVVDGEWSATGLKLMAAYGITKIMDLPKSKYSEALARAKAHAKSL